MTSVQGSCLCGAIAFEMTGTPRGVTQCHCTRCRKVRGTGHAVNLLVSLDGCRYLRGEEQITQYRLPEAKYFGHWFCRVCGSSVPRLDEQRGIAIIPMGAFDEDPGVRPDRHIHVGSKAAWETILDDLPQFDAGPPKL
jgi:hypothetical protein